MLQVNGLVSTLAAALVEVCGALRGEGYAADVRMISAIFCNDIAVLPRCKP